MIQGITYHAEELRDEDGKTVFFTREMNGATVVLVPKSKYKMFETENTYVLEMIKED